MAFLPTSQKVYFVLLIFSAWCLLTCYSSSFSSNWLNHGGDMYNRRYAKSEYKISPYTASKLKLKWEFFAGKDITATPAIFNGILYFPCWNGFIYAVNADDGSLVWEKSVGELTGLNGTGLIYGVNWTVGRATPVIAGDLLIIGIYGPAIVLAVERATGELVWLTKLSDHPASCTTMSGTVYNGYLYLGASSMEEGLPAEQCCTFRGSLAKLDIRTGSILWQTYTLPDNFGKKGGYAGATVWGSSPSIDIKRNLVYVSTGYLYSVPSHIKECQEMKNNQTIPANSDQCIEPDNHANSVLAFDMNSGNMKWSRYLGGNNVWFFACTVNHSTPGCALGPSPNGDFGEAPMMLTIRVNGAKHDIVTLAQKSGYAYALDRDNGNTIWSTSAGPGGYVGGANFGAATDGKRVYTNIANSDAMNFTLAPSNKVTTGGGWVAMHAHTGEILWSTANPTNSTCTGPVSVANNVLFGGSNDPEGAIYAMDVKTGKILWTSNTGATVYGGMSVSNGCVYVGNGFNVTVGASIATVTAGTSLYAYCIA